MLNINIKSAFQLSFVMFSGVFFLFLFFFVFVFLFLLCEQAVWMRFFPAMAEIRKQIAEGVLGEVKHVHATFGFRNSFVPHRLAQPELGGGAVLDLGVYCINFSDMVFGERPEKILCSGTLQDTGVDETVSVILR